jgi:predicted ATPase
MTTAPMIKNFKVEDFRCLKRVELRPTALHALIGPNDSGKSTILRALGEATGFASRRTGERPRFKFSLQVVGAKGTCLAEVDPGVSSVFKVDDATRTASFTLIQTGGVKREGDQGPWVDQVLAQLLPSVLVRFDPDALRRGSSLLPEAQLGQFLLGRGAGMPGVYQYIQGRGGGAFSTIEGHVQELFPNVEALRVVPVTPSELVLEVELHNGAKIRPVDMSEGLLYYLAFEAIPHVAQGGTLLIEEPENGLHPARIRDVVRMLRKFVEQNNAQVIMATHSPLVVNELKPDEVTIVWRTPEDGTKTVLIKDTPNFERRSKTAELGELWLSYADGNLEAPLVGEARA